MRTPNRSKELRRWGPNNGKVVVLLPEPVSAAPLAPKPNLSSLARSIDIGFSNVIHLDQHMDLLSHNLRAIPLSAPKSWCDDRKDAWSAFVSLTYASPSLFIPPF